MRLIDKKSLYQFGPDALAALIIYWLGSTGSWWEWGELSIEGGVFIVLGVILFRLIAIYEDARTRHKAILTQLENLQK